MLRILNVVRTPRFQTVTIHECACPSTAGREVFVGEKNLCGVDNGDRNKLEGEIPESLLSSWLVCFS